MYFWFLCRKMEKCNFWINLVQKEVLGRESKGSREKKDRNALSCLSRHGGTSLHLIASAQRAGTYLQKIQKFRGGIAILEKLGF